MEIFLIRVLQFMLAISILVLLHEGGHFFFAKLFGIRVEKFYLFFDPWFHLFEFKPKKSHTTYGIGWLPLGGYCKISGMIDESFDTEQMKKPAQPWEFRTKPAWQRLLVMVGGVLVNFLLALFIYSMILFHWGDTYIPVRNMTHGMVFNSDAKALGFKDGDILIGTEKGEFKDFNADLYRDLSEARRVDIVRQGKAMSLSLPGDLNMLDMLQKQPSFVRPLIPAEVDSVLPGTAAARMGMRRGDMVVGINGVKVGSWNAFTDEIGRLSDVLAVAKTPADSMKVRRATLVIDRGGRLDTSSVVLSADLKVGFTVKMTSAIYQPVTKRYGFWESFPAGVVYGVDVLKGYVSDMKYVFTADGAKSLGGFGAIGSLFPPTWDWYMFWKMTAFLSIILAFMNILPIPALDGGHVLFLLYEMITRRKPSENFMIRAEYVGFAILILLMLVANLNDILRWLGYM
ncbi:RIP metalloprotease RseP [Marseilla massiliensis]|jgi:regulator of sigma E protease|uniref:RIP metalloprotease RseP n=1 Tax=Marseilla massiliensis TaxID=1841864 RepID=UPI0020115688|nr:RIP metalloprotease RseP [Marseilla massiliensis]MCL1610135.1 RIP metalloprotease RseP [Marseilla massiliensis]MEE0361990.1 RIP metalloprotease RseP [Prevotella sp.]